MQASARCGSGCSAERKLGALALLRNLRNMHAGGVSEELVLAALAAMKTDRVLPFRFLAAARNAPQWEEALETAMFRSLEGRKAKLAGHTVLLVDVSGSMESPLSRRSEMRRTDAAYGLAILLREIAEKVTIYTFSDRRSWCRRGADWRCAMRWTRASRTAARISAPLSSRWRAECRGLRPSGGDHRRAVARPGCRSARARVRD